MPDHKQTRALVHRCMSVFALFPYEDCVGISFGIVSHGTACAFSPPGGSYGPSHGEWCVHVKKPGILAASLAFAFGLIFLATSCGGDSRAEKPQSNNGRIEVEFWHAMGSNQGRAVNELVDEFNRSQDRYFVQSVYQGNYKALNQKLIASVYAGGSPAISQMYPGWATRFFRYGYLQNAAHFVENDPEFAAQLDDFYPVVLEENIFTHPETGERILSTLPFNKSVYVLYVNQTRMEALGWTEPPRIWDDLIRLAEEMTVHPEGSPQPTFYGFGTRTYVEDLTVQAMAAGMTLMDEETGEILVNTPEVHEAFRFLRRLVTGDAGGKQVGYVESGYLSNAFGSERVGMFISSTASFTYNDMSVGNKFVWNAFRVPKRDEETEGKTLMQGTNLGIFKGVPPDAQLGAWEFAKFLSSPEINAKWAIQTGYMPVRRATLDVPAFAEHLQRDGRYANAVETMNTSTFEPRVLYWESVRDVVDRQVDAVMNGRRMVEPALADAEKQIRAIQVSQ